MSEHDRVLKAVYGAVDELNKQLPLGVSVAKSLDSPLYGASGILESLNLVSFITEVEEQIKAEFGMDITITDENLLSKAKSPFSSLRTLVDYLEDVLKAENHSAT